MKLNATRAMLITSIIIVLLYVLGLFLPIIKNTKNQSFYFGTNNKVFKKYV